MSVVRGRVAWGVAIHGGVGTIPRERMTLAQRTAYLEVLEASLRAGHAALGEGGSALDAVEAAVRVMEDSPLFNAGRGSVLTHEGTFEMDACIMSGRERKTGAVALVTGIRNPILAARAVLEGSDHVLLAGPGAEQFAREQDLAFEPEAYFATEERRAQLEAARARARTVLDHEGESALDDKYGTVGAVAVDTSGGLAAGTSTGGMTNKRIGRIGDSPLPGSGTFADENVAISCTGHGEHFIRHVVAHEVAARMRLANETLETAAGHVIRELGAVGGLGGLIAVDQQGNVALPMNTSGMFRGWLDADGEIRVAVFA